MYLTCVYYLLLLLLSLFELLKRFLESYSLGKVIGDNVLTEYLISTI